MRPAHITCARRPWQSPKRPLHPGVVFVCKIFQGEDFEEFKDAVCDRFGRHKIYKPQSCRKESKEIYIIGMGKTGGK